MSLETRLVAALAGKHRIERFLTEIRTTANLQHPHILPLHDSGAVDVTAHTRPRSDSVS